MSPFILPRKAGKGDRASARWKGRGRRGITVDDTPPPPCFAWSPSPAALSLSGGGKISDIRRRDILTLLAGAAASPVASFALHAQQSIPTIGFLHGGSPEQNVKRLAAWRRGLSEAGFVEGQNVAIEYRWAAGQNDKLPALAADLIARKVSVLVTAGSTPAAVAAKAATATIPIVFAIGADPIELGLVASLNRPGGNATGATSLNAELAAKRFSVLRELAPQTTHYFTVINPTSPLATPFVKDLEAGAATLGIHVDVLRASTDGEIAAAFAKLPQQASNALVFPPDSFFYVHRAQLAALAARYALPAIFDVRDYVDAGGLVSYGTDFLSVMQTAGSYTGRVLKGEKPADLPVVQAAKFELVINLQTAKALGLAVPPTLLALADEVIE